VGFKPASIPRLRTWAQPQPGVTGSRVPPTASDVCFCTELQALRGAGEYGKHSRATAFSFIFTTASLRGWEAGRAFAGGGIIELSSQDSPAHQNQQTRSLLHHHISTSFGPGLVACCCDVLLVSILLYSFACPGRRPGSWLVGKELPQETGVTQASLRPITIIMLRSAVFALALVAAFAQIAAAGDASPLETALTGGQASNSVLDNDNAIHNALGRRLKQGGIISSVVGGVADAGGMMASAASGAISGLGTIVQVAPGRNGADLLSGVIPFVLRGTGSLLAIVNPFTSQMLPVREAPRRRDCVVYTPGYLESLGQVATRLGVSVAQLLSDNIGTLASYSEPLMGRVILVCGLPQGQQAGGQAPAAGSTQGAAARPTAAPAPVVVPGDRLMKPAKVQESGACPWSPWQVCAVSTGPALCVLRTPLSLQKSIPTSCSHLGPSPKNSAPEHQVSGRSQGGAIGLEAPGGPLLQVDQRGVRLRRQRHQLDALVLGA